MDNLWGNLDDVKDFKIAKSILDEQALYIAKMTKQTLYAEVLIDNSYNDEILSSDDKNFYYKLVIKSEYLNKYEFKVLSIKHNLLQYPLEVFIPSDIAEDLKEIQEMKDRLNKSPYLETTLVAKNENEFILYLGHILKSKNLMQVIKALYKMSDF